MHRWIVWFLSSLFMFYKYAIEVSPSVMTADLMAAYQIDGAQLGNLAACYFYAYLLMQIPAGLLIDRIGPRKVTTLSILVCALGTLVLSHTESLSIACIGRFFSGLGAAFAAISSLKLIANWFPQRRFAFMTGLMMSLAMLGAVGGQGPLSLFIHSVGWRSALQIIGYSGFVFAAIFWLAVRDRAPHHVRVDLTSERVSLFKQCKSIFKNKQSWLLSLYSGLAFAPVSVFGGLWGVPFISRAYNLPSTAAAHAVSLIFIGFGVGAPILGWLSDQIQSRKKIMGWGTASALILAVAVLYVNLPPALLMTALFLFGCAISGFLVCFTMISERVAITLAATAVGFMNAFDAFLGAVSDPLTGFILDWRWQGELVNGARVFPVEAYKIALFTLPVYLAVSLILLFFIKETFKKDPPPLISSTHLP